MTVIDWIDGSTPLNDSTLSTLESTGRKGIADGYASLDATGKVPLAQLPPVGADLVYQGDYPAGTPYTDGEIVVYQGVAYMCVTPTSAAPTAWPGGAQPPVAPTITGPSYGTSLPASPTDGQEAILVDSTTNPSYQWRFRYNANSTSAYKWEFTGGVFPLVQTAPNAAFSSGSWTAVAGAASFAVPRAGDYQAEGWAEISNGTSPQVLYADVGTTSGGAYRMGVTAPGTSNVAVAGRATMLGLAASTAIKVFTLALSGTSCTINITSLRVFPVRVS